MAEQQTDRRTGDGEIRDLRDDRDRREPRIERLSETRRLCCPASIASHRRLNAAAAVAGDRLFRMRRLVIDELTNEQLRKVRVLAEQLCLGTNERADAVRVGGRVRSIASLPRASSCPRMRWSMAR